MNIVILDDYQDAVRKLDCASKLEPYQAKVYTNTVKGQGQLSVRLKDADIVVLIRERSHMSRQLIDASRDRRANIDALQLIERGGLLFLLLGQLSLGRLELPQYGLHSDQGIEHLRGFVPAHGLGRHAAQVANGQILQVLVHQPQPTAGHQKETVKQIADQKYTQKKHC